MLTPQMRPNQFEFFYVTLASPSLKHSTYIWTIVAAVISQYVAVRVPLQRWDTCMIAMHIRTRCSQSLGRHCRQTNECVCSGNGPDSAIAEDSVAEGSGKDADKGRSSAEHSDKAEPAAPNAAALVASQDELLEGNRTPLQFTIWVHSYEFRRVNSPTQCLSCVGLPILQS